MPGEDGLLFPNAARTGHLHVNTRSKTYHRARRVGGRPDLRVHDLRYSAATMAAQAGATLAELMARMGHSTPKSALVYQHVAEGRDRIIAERMALLAQSVAEGSPHSPRHPHRLNRSGHAALFELQVLDAPLAHGLNRHFQSHPVQIGSAYATSPGMACFLMVRRVSTITVTSASGKT